MSIYQNYTTMKTILTLFLILNANSQISSANVFSNNLFTNGPILEDISEMQQKNRRRRPVKKTYLIPSVGLRSMDLGTRFHPAYSAALALRMTKDLQFSEIKLAGHVNEYMEFFQVGAARRGTEIEYIGFDVGYVYGKTILNTSSFLINVGGISRIGYRDVKENPFTARDFPSDTRRYVLGLGLQAEFLMHLFETIDVGLAGDVPHLDIFRERKTVDNPILLSRDRTTQRNGSSFFSREFALRLRVLFQIG